MNSSLLPLLSFAAIIVLIPAALWLFKRTPLGASLAGSNAGLVRAIGTLPLSPTQRLLVVEVGQGGGRRWLVLGVTSSSITVLHTMEPLDDGGDDASAPPPPLPSGKGTPFEEFLGKLRQTKEDGNVH